MDVKELRIGNWINHRHSKLSFIVSEINAFNQNTVNGIELSDCEPIPLTKDWLLKFGFFIAETNGTLEATLINFRYTVQTANDYNGFFFCDGEIVLINFEYVHQLQNLFFSLSGKELILKTIK
jgi:hypothetical protein